MKKTKKIYLSAVAALVTLATISCTSKNMIVGGGQLVQSESTKSDMGFLANRKFIETGNTIIRVYYTNKKQITTLNELGMDVWMVEPTYVVGQVPQELLAQIKKTFLKIDMLSPREGYSVKNDFDPQYHTYDEMLAKLKKFASEYSQIASLHDYGDTWEKTKGMANRDLWIMRITGKGDGSKKPGIVFFGNHHARELVTVEIPLLLIEHLLSNYGKDPDITYLVDNREIWISPMVNPDGHIEAEQGMNWRKNMNRNDESSKYRWGVDLNRNYGYQWATGGSSSSHSSQTYHGKNAFSEPETQATSKFMESHKNLKIMMSYHSFSNLILWPYGYTHSPARDDSLFRKVGGKLGAMSGYKPESASDLYIASGITDDWSYGKLGLLSFTTEIGSWGDGFDPPYSSVPKFWKENKPNALYLIRLAGEEDSAFGPDISEVKVTNGGSLEVSFNQKYQNNAVRIEYFTNPNSRDNGTIVPLNTRGTALINTASLGNTNTIYLRAQGPDGKWGPVKAAALK